MRNVGTSRRLTSAQAAAQLGVDRATVYAYVSRGLLHPQREGRMSTFDAAEVEKLRIAGREGRRPTSSTAVVHTGVTYLSPDRLAYRGLDVPDLAGIATFETVCTWLWESVWDPSETLTGALEALRAPTHAGLSDASAVHVRAITAVLMAATHLAGGAPVAGDGAPDAGGREAALAAAPTLLRAAAASAALCPLDPRDVAHQPVARLLLTALSPQPVTTPSGKEIDGDAQWLLQAALVVLADHDLAASTLTVRVAASTGAPLPLALAGGLGTLAGPLHGGSGPATLALLDRCLHADPAAVLDRLLFSHRRVPGFGHVIYRRDPRAQALLDQLIRGPHDELAQTTRALIRAAADRGLPAPNVDLALAVLTRRLGLRDTAPETLHAVARIAGWTAHYVEELGERGRRFRPQSVYEGPPPGRRPPW
jgi:citrate synthase